MTHQEWEEVRMSKNRLRWWSIPVALILMWLILLGVNRYTQSAIHQYQVKIASANSDTKKSTKQMNMALDAKQPNIAAATKKLNQLYALDWTIANQKEFDGKAKAMSPLVSQEVINQSLDFKPDTDRMMTQTKVIMAYDHMDFMPTSVTDQLVKGKVVVYIKSHYEGKPGATTRFVYNISYNTQTDVITQLDRIGAFQLQSNSSLL